MDTGGIESSRRTTHHSAVPQSLAKILVHTVFSTKNRRPFLRDKRLREELHRYLGGIPTDSRAAKPSGFLKSDNVTPAVCAIEPLCG